jgi:hypothetical protein
VKGGEAFGGFGVGVEVVGLEELPHQLETIAGDSNVQQLNPSQLRHGRVRGHLKIEMEFFLFWCTSLFS